MNMSFTSFLIILLIISVLLNVYLYMQLKRYQINDRTYKARWQEVMGLHHPINAIIWAFVTIALFIGIMVLIVEVFNL